MKFWSYVQPRLYIVYILLGYEILNRMVAASGFIGLQAVVFVMYIAVLWAYPSYRDSKKIDTELEKMLADAKA